MCIYIYIYIYVCIYIYIIRKSYILTVKNNNWTLLIFSFFLPLLPLELETRLYYLSITIMIDTTPAQMGCSRTRK